MKNKTLRKGFTLIEVVIVLAIAALIMVVVFLAVQGAQRSQRDQTRKDVANQVLAGLNSYRGNNNGNGTTNASSLASYINWSSAAKNVNGVTITLETGTSVGSCSSTTGSVAITSNAPDTVKACLESDANGYTVNN